MSKEFISGLTTGKLQADCVVRYTPATKNGIQIEVKSKIEKLYGRSMRETAERTLKDLQIEHGTVKIEDGGAVPFVMQARIEAAVRMADPKLKLESLPPIEKHATYSSTRERFRRSRLYLPGNQPKLMLNAGIHKPDGIILDLEDAVALSEKPSARLIVRNALRVLDFFGAEKMVRINQGERGLEDIEFIVPQPVHLLLLPKIECADEIKAVDKKVKEVCKASGRTEPLFYMPILESGKGILNAYEIALASKNNVALAIGLEDYTADLGVQRTLDGKESFFARSMLVNAARAAGIQAIDTVFSDVGDMDGLRESVIEAKQLGFDGKGCIHPRQIRVIHDALAPSQAEIAKATKIVLAYEEAEKKGLGVVSLGSKMIDPPVVKRALHTVEMAVESGVLEREWKAALQKESAAK
ncbi:HpcH/HpaI aldolase/citrate lyase family protein [bacterium]|nr:HpcH/HpaI aldolase/citrate lyase family protein [bacterium]